MSWIVASLALLGCFAAGVLVGYAAGLRAGVRRGFTSAMRRAIEVERPLEALRRILVPRAYADASTLISGGDSSQPRD